MMKQKPLPQQKKAQATRLALLNAAREKFTLVGYADTSLDSIVGAAGVTKGALFHHFKDKADLFFEVWIALERQVFADCNTAADNMARIRKNDNPYAGFIAGCEKYFEYAQDPTYRRIGMIDGLSVLGEYEWRSLDSSLGVQTISRGLHALYKNNAIRTPPSKALIIMINGAVSGAAYAIAREEEGIYKEDLLARIETTLRLL